MRVLHLPVNIASIPYHTVRGLRSLGINAFGLLLNYNIQSAYGDGFISISYESKQNVAKKVFKRGLLAFYFIKWSAWADIVHWYFGSPVLPLGLDLKYLNFLKKRGVIEWLGSDIRIPEIEFLDNPYYIKAFNEGYEYKDYESFQRSVNIQKKFAEAGFSFIVPPCMAQYVQKDISSEFYILPQRIVLSDYQPIYPDPLNSQPLIVHSSSAPKAKGTHSVIKAIESLQGKYDFKFYLIQNMPRNKALKLVQMSDIFIDQFVLGTFGMAALEAMAFGKPVLSYIKHSMINKYPPDLPIVNANQDNLTEILEILLKDGKLRNKIGQLSRKYVERYHDAFKLSKKLVEIYKKVMKK